MEKERRVFCEGRGRIYLIRETGKCERCKRVFKLRWLFNGNLTNHTIDNHICSNCYGDWLKFVEGNAITIGGIVYKAGQNEFWEAFLETIKERIEFT